MNEDNFYFYTSYLLVNYDFYTNDVQRNEIKPSKNK